MLHYREEMQMHMPEVAVSYSVGKIGYAIGIQLFLEYVPQNKSHALPNCHSNPLSLLCCFVLSALFCLHSATCPTYCCAACPLYPVPHALHTGYRLANTIHSVVLLRRIW